MQKSTLNRLADNVDIMFAVTGGVHNIGLKPMMKAIDVIRPKVVIPMHYYSARGRLKILPVTAFTERYPQDHIVWTQGPELELTREGLPVDMRIYVLEQCR